MVARWHMTFRMLMQPDERHRWLGETDSSSSLLTDPNGREIMSTGYRHLHRAFRLSSGRYALGFPQPGEFQVWAGTVTELSSLSARLNEKIVFRDYFKNGEPIEFDPSTVQGWMQYARFRVSSLKSYQNIGKPQFYHPRVEQARKLLNFNMMSGDNSQIFLLTVNPKKLDLDDVVKATDHHVKPNNYGLSVATRAFALPVLA